MLINVYFVDDRQESVDEFTDAAEDLSWINYLFKSGMSEIKKSSNSDYAKYELQKKIVSNTSLSDENFDKIWCFVRTLTDNDIRTLSGLQSINISLTLKTFCMINDVTYESILHIVKSDLDNCALLLDLYWGNYVTNESLLSRGFIRKSYLDLPEQNTDKHQLGAYNLGCEFLCNGRNRFLIGSTQGRFKDRIEYYLDSDNLSDCEKVSKSTNKIIDVQRSVEKDGAHVKIIELLLAKEKHISPVMEKFKAIAINEGWFKYGNLTVPHDFSLDRQSFVATTINEHICLPIKYYTEITHDGLKNYCLNRVLCNKVLYTTLIIASVRSASLRGLDNQKNPPKDPVFSSDIPFDRWSNRNPDEIDTLVKCTFDLFLEFCVSHNTMDFLTELKSFTIVFEDSVEKLSKSTVARINFYKVNNYWEDEGADSLNFARIIMLGGFGFSDFSGCEITPCLSKNVNVYLQNNKVLFSWA